MASVGAKLIDAELIPVTANWAKLGIYLIKMKITLGLC
jgi:hypothetical protein